MHNDIDLAEFTGDLISCAFDSVRIGGVCLHGQTFNVFSFDLRDKLVGSVFVAVIGDRNICAFFGKFQCNGGTDSPRAACYNRCFAVQSF